ncbi:homeobox transcription factor [Verticillium dahliae]
MCQTTQLLSSAHFLSQTFNITGPEICPTDSLSSIASSQDTRGRRRGQEFKVSFMPPPYDATRAGAFPPQSTDIDIMTPMEQSPSSSPSASDRISPNNSQSEIPPATPKAQVQVEAPLDAATSATDEKHPKGKRKRTAAKDKTILEEAYQTNPKPDKTARHDIVQRVSLTEKEVQIWFQNRRQNDRRKSRPLSPQEIAALRYGGMQVLSSDPVTSSSLVEAETAQGNDCFSTPSRPIDPGPTSSQNQSFIQSFVDNVKESSTDSVSRGDGIAARSSSPHNDAEAQRHSQDLQTISTPLPATVGYLANRWNLSSTFPSKSCSNQVAETPRQAPFRFSSPPSTIPKTPALPTPQSQSHVRISLSLEGKAELVANDESLPQSSPLSSLPTSLPRLLQGRPRSLHRSQSAAAHVTLPPISALTQSISANLGRGRSRDAQVWELCCDSDQRDELTTQAENESSGSAVAAISLLRSTSGILQPNSAKRNAPPLRNHSGLSNKKPRLSRALSGSAVASSISAHEDHGQKSGVESKGPKMSLFISSASGNDSDKENWSPDGDGVPPTIPRQHPTPTPLSPCQTRKALPLEAPHLTHPRRQVRGLREQTSSRMLGNSRANTAPLYRRRKESSKDLEVFEDHEGLPMLRPDREVETFMRGEVSPGKKGDMDCIAGLLSLSQGNWR